MRMPLSMRIDAEGRPRARWLVTGPVEVVLPQFLETDLGFNRSYGEFLVDQAQRVCSGEVPSWEGTGNAFSVMLGPEMTTIEPLYPSEKSSSSSSEAVSLPTTELVAVLERWLGMVGGYEDRA